MVEIMDNRSPQVGLLDRRDALRRAAGFFTAGLLTPVAGALSACSDPGAKAVNPVLDEAGRGKFLAALVDRIIPETDTPGAAEAGVPTFVDLMVGDFYDEGYRSRFMSGVEALAEVARKRHDADFTTLSSEQQDALLTAASNGELGEAMATFFEEIRQLTILGYYTSEIGMMVERIYLPVPGRYDGDYPYEEGDKLYSL